MGHASLQQHSLQVSTDDVPGYSVLGQNSSARNDIEEMVDTEVKSDVCGGMHGVCAASDTPV